MGVFYEDDGMIGLRDAEFIQGDINVLIRIFRRVVLALKNPRPQPASQGKFAQVCRRRISVGGVKERGPLTGSVCSGTPHAQTAGWS